MKITIRLGITNKVLFEGEYESTKHAVIDAVAKQISLWGADLQGADLQGADLWGADLQGADLRSANLWGVNLRGANLRGANLWGANLRGANLWGEKLVIPPIQLLGFRWWVLITPQYLKIGCERYTHAEWKAFKRTDIAPMDDKAWDWWKEHKTAILALCDIQAKQAEEINKGKENNNA